jgi:Rrf2 family protein
MKLSRASNLALYAVVYLAARKGEARIGSQEIARVLGLSENQLVRIMKDLVAARVLWSIRGPGGGYQLARAASRISLLEVLEGIEGPIGGVVPCLAPTGYETIEQRLTAICDNVAECTRSVLGKISIADLLEKSDGELPLSTQEKHTLPPDVAEGLEQIRKLMAARNSGPDRGEDG